ncbi:CCA tRNA nucleotidyltransferase [Candidatus Gottesmanbacteria bacterium]|nr:CCA tRNA nucleotidyltransferase [Candidatus Gottesmanbacteria bacterium]
MINLKLPDNVIKTISILKDNNFQAFLVGGSVRDLLMGKITQNWDFTTDCPPEEILKLFRNSFYDNKFGTVGIPQENKQVFEITTFRSEHGYSDSRHPDKVVWGKSLEEDLSRRDFTINAIAYDGGNITDPYHGQEDIKRKVIKTVGDPGQRFSEDALRLIRAVRIATELQFTIDNQTLLAISKNAHLIHNISNERVKDELYKILPSDHPSEGIELLKETGLLKEILPELDKNFGIEQKSPERHHIYDVGTHLVMSLKYCKSKDPTVKLATLLHDIGKADTYKKLDDGVITFYNHEIIGTKLVRNIADRLKLSKKEKDKLITLVRWHQFTVDERQTDKAIRRFIRRITKEYINDMLDLRVADRLGGGARETSWRLEEFKKRIVEVQKQPFTVADLKINGFDVMKELNIKPGPKVGEILNQLFKEVEENKIKNEREVLLERLKSINDQHL